MLFKGSKGVHLRPIKLGALFVVAVREREAERKRERERAWHAEADKTGKAYL